MSFGLSEAERRALVDKVPAIERDGKASYVRLKDIPQPRGRTSFARACTQMA